MIEHVLILFLGFPRDTKCHGSVGYHSMTICWRYLYYVPHPYHCVIVDWYSRLHWMGRITSFEFMVPTVSFWCDVDISMSHCICFLTRRLSHSIDVWRSGSVVLGGRTWYWELHNILNLYLLIRYLMTILFWTYVIYSRKSNTPTKTKKLITNEIISGRFSSCLICCCLNKSLLRVSLPLPTNISLSGRIEEGGVIVATALLTFLGFFGGFKGRTGRNIRAR
jgi:hypothetical protein